MDNFKSYIKDYPFVFVSYSHKNEDIILSLTQSLRGKRINLWYDHDIIAREVWDDKIAGQIQASRIVVCFITEDYLRSDHCVDELKYALNKRKDVLILCVKGVSLPGGLDMRLGSKQIVMVDNAPDIPYMTRRICECQEIRECKMPPVATPDPSEETLPRRPPKPSDDEMLQNTAIVSSSRPQKAKRPITKKLIMIPLALLISLALFLVGNSLFGASHESYTAIIADQTIDGSYWKYLQRMKKLKSIQFQNCTFTADIADSGTLAETLQTFSAIHCDGIEYLDMLAEQDGLASLALTNCNAQSNDLDYHFPASLTSVDLSGNTYLNSVVNCLEKCKQLKQLDLSETAVYSLTGLPLDALETLDISRTKLDNLAPLHKAANLTKIHGEECSFTSINPLAKLEHLTEIDLSDAEIRLADEEFLALRLKRLDLSGNYLSDIGAFTNCTILEDVDLSGNKISNINVLSKSATCLKKLRLSGNPISQEAVSTLLKQCSKLTELWLDGIPLCAPEDSAELNLASVSHLLELRTLSLSGCNLYNIGGILPLRKLTYLDLSNNHISEIRQFPAQDTWRDLNLMNNPCTSIDGLMTTKFNVLVLYDPDPQVLHLPASLNGLSLLVSGNVDPQDLIQVAPNFFHIYIVDYPLDKRVALEDSIDANNLSWITEADIPALLSEWNM